jgi:hypothetical protein
MSETTRPQDITKVPFHKTAKFPWLIISHVVAIIVGGVLSMNVMAYNNAAIQSAVDARAQNVASKIEQPKK